MKDSIQVQDDRLVISYLNLRKLIGLLGFLFPAILIIGGAITGNKIQSSISYYYHTDMHDIFVAVLCVVAAFLMAYKGYEKKDDIAGNVAGFCALGVAMVPTTILNDPTPNQILIGKLHLVFATGYFLSIAYFCLFLFIKTKKDPSKRKTQRNSIYKFCGTLIIVCLIFIALYTLVIPDDLLSVLSKFQPVFWLESIAVMAFGFSWLVKGEAILTDEVASKHI